MTQDKLKEGQTLMTTIEDYKSAWSGISDNLKDYNISSDIKAKIKNLFS